MQKSAEMWVRFAGMLVLLWAWQAMAQGQEAGAWKKRWLVSSLALAGAETMDVVSSNGAQEANPLLRGAGGQFSLSKGIALKAGAVGALMLFEAFTLRRPGGGGDYKPFTIVNSAAAAGFAAVAAHNFRVNSQSSPPAYLLAH